MSILDRIARVLAISEARISLLDRCRPLRAEEELDQLERSWSQGQETAPQLRYRTAVDLSEVRTALDVAAKTAAVEVPYGPLYAERAGELDVEAKLAETVGSPAFVQSAAQRFRGGTATEAREAHELASEWVQLPSDVQAEEHRSDDPSDPHSLLTLVLKEVGRRKLACRVESSHDLQSAAATGTGRILIRAGLRLSRRASRRIALHEVEAHAAPRDAGAKSPLKLLAVGSAHSGDDEEGRALCIEERSACLDHQRRRELGRRHLAAQAIRDGADFVQAVRLLRDCDTPLSDALRVTMRAARGGGLAREVVYIPSYLRCRAAFRSDPGLEAWLACGRVSLRVAEKLDELGLQPHAQAERFEDRAAIRWP